MSLQRLATARIGKQVYELEHVGCTPGRTRRPSSSDTWQVGPATGSPSSAANGAGKTTLLRLLAGVTRPDGGRSAVGSTVRVGVPLPGTRRAPATCGYWRRSRGVARRCPVWATEDLGVPIAEIFGSDDRRLWTRSVTCPGCGERRASRCSGCSPPEPTCPLRRAHQRPGHRHPRLAGGPVDSWTARSWWPSRRYLIDGSRDGVGMFGDGRVVHLPGGVDEYLPARPSARPGARFGGPARRRTRRPPAHVGRRGPAGRKE